MKAFELTVEDLMSGICAPSDQVGTSAGTVLEVGPSPSAIGLNIRAAPFRPNSAMKPVGVVPTSSAPATSTSLQALLPPNFFGQVANPPVPPPQLPRFHANPAALNPHAAPWKPPGAEPAPTPTMAPNAGLSRGKMPAFPVQRQFDHRLPHFRSPPAAPVDSCDQEIPPLPSVSHTILCGYQRPFVRYSLKELTQILQAAPALPCPPTQGLPCFRREPDLALAVMPGGTEIVTASVASRHLINSLKKTRKDQK